MEVVQTCISTVEAEELADGLGGRPGSLILALLQVWFVLLGTAPVSCCKVGNKIPSCPFRDSVGWKGAIYLHYASHKKNEQ